MAFELFRYQPKIYKKRFTTYFDYEVVIGLNSLANNILPFPLNLSLAIAGLLRTKNRVRNISKSIVISVSLDYIFP